MPYGQRRFWSGHSLIRRIPTRNHGSISEVQLHLARPLRILPVDAYHGHDLVGPNINGCLTSLRSSGLWNNESNKSSLSRDLQGQPGSKGQKWQKADGIHRSHVNDRTLVCQR